MHEILMSILDIFGQNFKFGDHVSGHGGSCSVPPQMFIVEVGTYHHEWTLHSILKASLHMLIFMAKQNIMKNCV